MGASDAARVLAMPDQDTTPTSVTGTGLPGTGVLPSTPWLQLAIERQAQEQAPTSAPALDPEQPAVPASPAPTNGIEVSAAVCAPPLVNDLVFPDTTPREFSLRLEVNENEKVYHRADLVKFNPSTIPTMLLDGLDALRAQYTPPRRKTLGRDVLLAASLNPGLKRIECAEHVQLALQKRRCAFILPDFDSEKRAEICSFLANLQIPLPTPTKPRLDAYVLNDDLITLARLSGESGIEKSQLFCLAVLLVLADQPEFNVGDRLEVEGYLARYRKRLDIKASGACALMDAWGVAPCAP